MKGSLGPKTGNASITSHHHIVLANWSLCLNNVGLWGSIFATLFFFFFFFLIQPASFVWICACCQLRSVVPSPDSVWWRARRMTRNNGAINSHLRFLRWPCHRRLRGSEVRRAKCQQHSATRCTSSHSADLKSVASIWRKAENTSKAFCSSSSFCTSVAVAYFYNTETVRDSDFAKIDVDSGQNWVACDASLCCPAPAILLLCYTKCKHVAQLWGSINSGLT